MEKRKFVCVVCDATFEAGRYMGCQDNVFQKHKVEPRTYWSIYTDFVRSISTMKEQRVTNPQNGASMMVLGTVAAFKNNQYTTDDPQIQVEMDMLKANGALSTEEAVVKSKMTDKQRAVRAEGQAKEATALLDKVRKENDDLKQKQADHEAHAQVERLERENARLRQQLDGDSPASEVPTGPPIQPGKRRPAAEKAA